MTQRGHFIINGAPRIIVNQLIRAEGIYYKQEIHTGGKHKIYRTFYMDIISKRGVWIRFELDKKQQIAVCMKKTPKIPIYLFLKSIGFTHKMIFRNFSSFYQFRFQYIYDSEESSFGIYQTHQLEEEKINQNNVFQKFLNIQSYDLGENGRVRLNSKLGLNLKTTILTPLDIMRITYLLLEQNSNQIQYDDIDDLKNRRIRTIGELLQLQVQQSLLRLQKILTEKNKKSDILPHLISTKPLNSTLQEFFNSCVLSQFLDQVNPLAELTHKRRVSALGPNGIKRETAGMDIRSIHSTYFGRICPIETPEGKNAGLVNSLTMYTLPNSHGLLESPYQPVFKGQIQKHLQPLFFSAAEENPFAVIFADQRLSPLNFLLKSDLSGRQYTKLTRVMRDQIQFCHYSPLQLISIATSVIPFLEHNDANRVLMGSNMQRQAVPLLISDASNVATISQNRIISDTESSKTTPSSGIVLYTSKNTIDIYNSHSINLFINKKKPIFREEYSIIKNLIYGIIINKKNKKYQYSVNINDLQKQCLTIRTSYSYSKNINLIHQCLLISLHLNFDLTIYCNLNIRFQNFDRFTPKILSIYMRSRNLVYLHTKTDSLEEDSKIQTIALQPFEKTNQGTFQVQKPIVSTYEWLYKGDLVADCASSENGRLALGRNLLVAYIPWEGYNFEDAIILNENLILNETFNSLHIEKYEIEVQETIYGMEQITRNLPSKNIKVDHLDKNGIIKLGSHVSSGMILIGKTAPIEPKPLLPHEKLLYDIVGKTAEKVKDVSLYAPSTIDGRVVYISVDESPYKIYSFDSETCIHICLYIAEKRNLQIGDKLSGRHGNKGVISKILPNQDLPFLLNGEIVDIVLNPLGVPSRMNVGQLFEALLGLASRELREDYKIEIFDEQFGFDTSRSLVYFKLLQLRNKTKQKWYFSKHSPGKMFLFDGRTGERFLEPTTIGETYILKLIHLVEDKIHARSTGPYSLVTQQPLKGRAKHGGQRFGEMEVWALEGFGSAYILQELLTIKSDDTMGRTRIMETILNNNNMYFGTPESFKVLLRELQSLCLHVKICNKFI